MICLGEISKSEAARYMGVSEAPDSQTARLLEKYEPIVRKALRPAYVYREAKVKFAPEGVYLSGLATPLTGEDIRRHLENCGRAVVFAATVSSAADKLIRTTSVTDMAGALAVDCLCSTAVEQVCELAEKEIFSELTAAYRTWRYSPGYGDLPIELQGELLKYLNAQRRIGLTCSESNLLVPTKSVTAIIGISDKPIEGEEKGCNVCRLRNSCGIRKFGGCGKK